MLLDKILGVEHDKAKKSQGIMGVRKMGKYGQVILLLSDLLVCAIYHYSLHFVSIKYYNITKSLYFLSRKKPFSHPLGRLHTKTSASLSVF